jgi:hypothetical protein
MSDEKQEQPGGVNVEGGGDVTVGGDVAGRDVVKTTTTTTIVGFSPKDVQRLIITVGVIVFVTAGIFFSGGLAVGFVALRELNRTVNSDNPPAADRFESLLTQLRALPPGQPFTLEFTEEEISSYFRLRLAPQVGVTDGRVRLLDQSSQLVVGGQASDLGGLPFAATFEWQDTPGAPLRLTSAAIQVLQLKDKDDKNLPFGWVFVPTPLLQPLASNLNNLFGNVQLTDVAATAPQTWTLSGVAR